MARRLQEMTEAGELFRGACDVEHTCKTVLLLILAHEAIFPSNVPACTGTMHEAAKPQGFVCGSQPEDGVGLADVHVPVDKPWEFRGKISGMRAGMAEDSAHLGHCPKG